MILADILGGPDLMVWLLLAFGGALFVGNILALVRPPAKQANRPTAKRGASPTPVPASKRRITEDDLKAAAARQTKAPKLRTIAMAAIGFVVSIWSIASLLKN
jgi:hypothetical protein